MTWMVFSVPREKRSELDTVLKDDLVSRQSQTVREAATLGGPADHLYVLIEGSSEGTRRASELLGPVAPPVPVADADAIYRQFKEEQDAASVGMGLFFTEE